jgi:succinate dehydrogenase / fumarate reductase cytochrome b subunit
LSDQSIPSPTRPAPALGRPARSARGVLGTSTAAKLLLAVTGLMLFAFLPIHLAGNLMVFAGRDAFNHYAHKLISNPLTVPLELGLLSIFLLHVWKALAGFGKNRAARPERYLRPANAGGASRRTWASTGMIVTGLWTFLFLAVHLKGLKFGTYYEGPDGVRDLYRTQMEVLADPLNAAFYAVSMVLIGMHLRHGFWSALQSLGLGSSRWTPRLVLVARVLAVVLPGGFLFIVFCAFTGLFLKG